MHTPAPKQLFDMKFPLVHHTPPMNAPSILKTIKNMNTISTVSSLSDRHFLAEEFSDDATMAAIQPAALETRVVKISKNTNQKLIIVTKDKTLLCLKRNLAQLRKDSWIAPLSTMTTILIALITADFKYALWLGAAEWKAMFVFAGFISTGWLAIALRKSLHTKAEVDVIHDIVNQMGGHVSNA